MTSFHQNTYSSMKRLIPIAATIFSIQMSMAQTGPITMEEAVLRKGISVPRYEISWKEAPEGCFLQRVGNRWSAVDCLSGEKTEFHPERKQDQRMVRHGGDIAWKYDDGTEFAITKFRDPGIVCGNTVSRNEFSCSEGLFPSPDGSLLAFYVKDERKVSTFPLLDIHSGNGKLREIRYPMNGQTSEKLQIGVFDPVSRGVTYLDVTEFTDERYLTNPTWSPDSRYLFVQVLDRSQKHMVMNMYDACSGKKVSTLFDENDERFVEPSFGIVFLKDDPDRFIYTSTGRDAYQSLYLYSLKGGKLERLTKTDADVEYVGQDGRNIYYYSAEVSPVERHLFRINLKSRRTERLTKEEGWHICTVSPDGRFWTDEYSSLHVPRVVAISSTDGKYTREIRRDEDPTQKREFCPIELGSIPSADPRFTNYYRLIRPAGFDPTKKYPIILYVYGGPHSQMVRNTFLAELRYWEMYMAQHGYVVFVMDNRGTKRHGAEYEKAIHRQCGKCEMEDQMEGIKWLLSHPWADSERVGVCGWSYGGFMTITLAIAHPEIFKVAVAGGPVIDWRWYEIMYGERYMETEETNREGLESTSLVGKAKLLQSKLLICQGTMDDTVVCKHSLSFIDECVHNNIPVDYFPYPSSKHNVSGRDRIHLMQKITDYFNANL